MLGLANGVVLDYGRGGSHLACHVEFFWQLADGAGSTIVHVGPRH
jgi:hypothetical protein